MLKFLFALVYYFRYSFKQDLSQDPSFASWLCTSCKNEALNLARKLQNLGYDVSFVRWNPLQENEEVSHASIVPGEFVFVRGVVRI